MPPKKRPATVEKAPCALCKADVEKAEGFCAGCGHVVCASCDTAQPWGKHALLDHRGD